MIDLTPEQQKLYDAFIKHRDKVRYVITRKNFMNEAIPFSDIYATVDIVGMNHPLFVENTPWIEFIAARMAWLGVEPTFRNEERMRASRGDYGDEDSWDDVVDKNIKEL